MLDSIITAAVKFFALAPRYLVIIALTSGIVLFFGEGFLKTLGLAEFVQDNRSWLGGAFLVSTSVVVVSGGIWLKDLLLTNYKKKRKIEGSKQKIIDRLQRLTEDEKQILRFYFAKNTRSNTLRIDDGVVNGLVAAGIIFQSASMGTLLEGFAHNITDFAWEHIHEHPKLLFGETNTYRTDKRTDM